MYVIITSPDDPTVHIRFAKTENEVAAHQQVATVKYGYDVQLRKPVPWTPRKAAAA